MSVTASQEPEAVEFASEAEASTAAHRFGPRLGIAERYAGILASAGLERGLLGPREVPRLWSRHLLNCVALTDLLPADTRLVDVGTGAGLPGLVVAIARPDVRVDLVESLQRRVDFLTEAVTLLGLEDQVRVVRGRAEDSFVVDEVGEASWVTARAVAPLDRLVKWCLPLLRPGGELLAMKGASAVAEVTDHAGAIRALGGVDPRVVTCGADLDEPVPVVVVTRGPTGQGSKRRKARQ